MATPTDEWGRTVEDYIRIALLQAKDDAINLGQIAFWGRSHLRLDESELIGFVKNVVLALLNAGASVVRSVQKNDKYEWEIIDKYDLPDKPQLVRSLIQDSNIFHPDHDFLVWFSFNP